MISLEEFPTEEALRLTSLDELLESCIGDGGGKGGGGGGDGSVCGDGRFVDFFCVDGDSQDRISGFFLLI